MSSDYVKETWVDEVLADSPTYNISGTGAGQSIVLDQTVVTPGTEVDAAVMQNIEDQLEKDDIFLREIATEKTVSGGVLTCDLSRHKIQPQSGTSDDIDTISGLEEDTFVILFASDPGVDTLTFKHGTGNISCFGGADINLSRGMVIGYYDGITVHLVGGNVVQDLSAYVNFLSTSVASSATPAPTGNAKRNEYYLTALAVGATFSIPSGTPVNGNMLLVRYKDDGTARTLAWNAIYRTLVGTLPTTTVISKTGYVLFVYNSADSKWDCLAAGKEA